MSVSAIALSSLFISAVALAQPGTRTVMEAGEAPSRAEDTVLASSWASDPHLPIERNAPWYGWKIMLGDAALGVAIAGLGVTTHYNGWDSNTSAAFAIAGIGSYVLTPALIHGFNGGGPGRIAGSVALRLGLPVVGFALGAMVSPHQGDVGVGAGALPGSILGLGVALGLDWFWLSRNSTDEAHKPSGAVDSLSLAPTIGRDGRWGLELSARW